MDVKNEIQLKLLKLHCKKKERIQNTLRSSALIFHKISKCRTEMALSFSAPLIWISFSKQQPFILLWATSTSKIRCKVSLYVTVKGHWERSVTFTARLHCVTLLHTIYKRIAQTDSPTPTEYIATLWIEVSVLFLVSFFFFFFTKEN